jgi:hypothetical protein
MLEGGQRPVLDLLRQAPTAAIDSPGYYAITPTIAKPRWPLREGLIDIP